MQGFFSSQSLVSERVLSSLLPQCGRCGLYKTCKNPKMPVSGKGGKKVLIVAEAPGEEEDARNVQLVGAAGQYLRKMLKGMGISLDRDCWKTNAVICRPPKNATPEDHQIESCRPNLLKTIDELKPVVIIPLGGTAVKSLISHLWGEAPGSLGTWVGMMIPAMSINAWVCPSYHPSFLLRNERGGGNPSNDGSGTWRKPDDVGALLTREHLRAAFALKKRPWKEVPDYTKQVQIIHSPEEAAKLIRKHTKQSSLAAFDYEANMLKPDSAKAEIRCASICFDGHTTIAFPWHRRVVHAMKEFLESSVGKIAANLIMEDRWSRAKLGVQVQNWFWDTCIGAHVEDNRSDITGLKFQAFVKLGMPLYDGKVSAYLRSSREGGLNQIHKVPWEDLLLYNGLDSLLAYHVARIQRHSLGYN